MLKEAVRKERPKLRLNAEQLEQRRAAEVRTKGVQVRCGTSCAWLLWRP